MPLRNTIPVIWRPSGASDARDGSNAFRGAMYLLQNLIPDRSTRAVWACRPAATVKTKFPGFSNPGVVSGQLVVGNRLYGMIATSRNADHDEPFVYDLSSDTFLTVSGITFGNTPSTEAPAPGTQPVIIAQVASRVLVCHPGFPGGTIKFGWFDISGFVEVGVMSTTMGTNTLLGNMSILGVQPGMTVVGSAIPADAVVVSTGNYSETTTGDVATSSPTISNIDATVARVGMDVSGAGIPVATTVLSRNIGANTVTMSQDATANGTTEDITFTGTIINIDANATIDTEADPITVAGGSLGLPQWGAGDVDNVVMNNAAANDGLPEVPVAVAQFNNRAYFCCGTFIPFSDAGFPCRQSNATNVQVLETGDGLRTNMIAPLSTSALLTGTAVQSLIVFEFAYKMQQITGDQTTGDLAMNALSVATGTFSPLSAVPCTAGIAFLAPDGLRFIDRVGNVSAPIGVDGKGISFPFTTSEHQSRFCAAANYGVIRVSCLGDGRGGVPYQEWWYDLSRQLWSGPHTFPALSIQPWEDRFIVVPHDVTASLWVSDPIQKPDSVFIENGNPLAYAYQTALLPDNELLKMNAIVESNLAGAEGVGNNVVVRALDEDGMPIPGGLVIMVPDDTELRERWMEWTQPLIFKQMSIQAHGYSNVTVRLGNLYFGYQILGYNIGEGGDAGFFLLDDYTLVPLADDYLATALLTPG